MKCSETYDIETTLKKKKENLTEKDIEIIFGDEYDNLPSNIFVTLFSDFNYNNVISITNLYPEYKSQLNSEYLWKKLYDKEYGDMYNKFEIKLRDNGDKNPLFDGIKAAFLHRRNMYIRRIENNPLVTTNGEFEKMFE